MANIYSSSFVNNSCNIFQVLEKYNKTVSVRRLRLHACQLGDIGLRVLISYLLEVKKIPAEIHLSHNNISTVAAFELAEALG